MGKLGLLFGLNISVWLGGKQPLCRCRPENIFLYIIKKTLLYLF